MSDQPHGHGVDEAMERKRLLAALADPDCPWDVGRRSGSVRRIEVDAFFAFAYQRGCLLAGIERRCDELVASLGGRRELADTKGPVRSALPVYVVPL